MIVLESPRIVSIPEYIAAEETSGVKHKFIGGLVFAMDGFSNQRSTIGLNSLGSLHFQLHRKRCQVFNSSTKVRIEGHSEPLFCNLACPSGVASLRTLAQMRKTTVSWVPAISSKVTLISVILLSFYLRFRLEGWPPPLGYVDERPAYILFGVLFLASIVAFPSWLTLVAMRPYRPQNGVLISHLALYFTGWVGICFYFRLDPWGAFAWWFD